MMRAGALPIIVLLAIGCGPTAPGHPGDDTADDGGDDGDDGPPACAMDRDLEGCVCPNAGEVRPCWPDGAPPVEGVGACRAGSQVCVAGAEEFDSHWGPCTGAVLPTDDVSTDGQDQDCDGDDYMTTCATEACGNGTDDDCDGLVDCGDNDCSDEAACNPCPSSDESCENGLDDDCDGVIDCFDTDCWFQPICIPTCLFEICENGADDDCDGLADCADPDCASQAACCTCTPGTSRYCDTPTACTWGVQSCLPDGSWGTCVEQPPPAACSSFTLYNTNCCLSLPAACCQDFHDTDADGDNFESVGECNGIQTCGGS
jgi:hypothetical protein